METPLLWGPTESPAREDENDSYSSITFKAGKQAEWAVPKLPWEGCDSDDRTHLELNPQTSHGGWDQSRCV